MKLFIKVFIAAVVVVFLWRVYIPSSGSQRAQALVGAPAPEFTLTSLDGQERSLTQMRDGKPTVILFWATWCPYCRKQLAELSQKWEEIKDKGIEVILVDVGESDSVVRGYLEDHQMKVEVLLDQETQVASVYGIPGLPTYFFLDPQGLIVDIRYEWDLR